MCALNSQMNSYKNENKLKSKTNLSLNTRRETVPNNLDIANMKSISVHSLKLANATNVTALL